MTTTSDVTTMTTHWRGQWLGYLGLALLAGFAFLPRSYYLMVTFPWILIWQLGFLLLGICCLLMLRQFDRPFRPLGYGLDWGIAAVAIACLVSAIWAPFRGVALWNLATVSGYGVVLYVVRNWIGTKGWSWLNLWRGLVISGLALSTTSLGLWLNLGEAGRISGRNYLPHGHHNFVAAYLCLVIPLVFSHALTLPRRSQLLLLAVACILPYNLYTCSSRGGLLGSLAWLVFTIGFVIWRSKGRQRQILSAISLVVLAGILTVVLQNSRVQRVIQIETNQGIIPQVEFKVDGQTEDRLFMWQVARNMISDRPLTGIGLGNMSRMFNLYRPINMGTGGTQVQQLHSTPIQLLSELGLLGGLAIALLCGQVLRLGWRIHHHTNDPQLKRLIYGLGGGYFAYGVATLTDYQLENIPISLTLLLFLVLLIAAGDRTLTAKEPSSLNEKQRRILSLGSLGGTLAALIVSLPLPMSMYLLDRGQRSWQAGNSETAFDQVATATAFASWDPSYNLRLGFWMLETRQSRPSTVQEYRKLAELAADYFQAAWATAPNDVYFNHNVGLLYSEINPVAAQPYLERSIQLMTRNGSLTYFMLGQAYLQQGLREQAITTFALQGLANPELLTVPEWDREPLAEIHPEVVKLSLAFHEQLLQMVEPEDPSFVRIQERIAVIRWWNDLGVTDDALIETFTPVVQAVLWGDRYPEKALGIVNAELAQVEADQQKRWLVLKAWLDPEYALTAEFRPSDIAPLQTFTLQSSDLPLNKWLKAIPQNFNTKYGRLVSILTYRNQDFERLDFVLLPQNVQRFYLVGLLKLTGDFPRTFPPIDQLITQIRTAELGLPAPTENDFRLEEPSQIQN